MNHYHVLLVDDEEEVIQIIMKKIDWESLGFTVIGYASNGVQALEMVSEDMPDVVMTDIKMPYMDGLELSRRLRKEAPDIRILLFTGFDEFEYAKEAVHLEIDEYILKPINSTELTETLTRLKTSLDKERSEKRNVEKLESYYMQSLPMLQTNFYTMMLEGRIKEDRLAEEMADCRIELTGPVYCVVIFHTSTHHIPEGMSMPLLTVSVQKQAEEMMKEKWRASLFPYAGDTVMVAQLESEQDVADLTDDGDRFVRSMKRTLGAIVTAGIGAPVTAITDLGQSYNGAREAVSYRALYGSSRSINIREIVPQEETYQEEQEDASLHEFLRQIRMGDHDSIRRAVDELQEKIRRENVTLKQYRVGVMDLLGSLYRFAMSNDLSLEEIEGSQEELYRTVPEMDQDTFHDWLIRIGTALQDNLSIARSQNTRSYVTNAKKYVRDHYADSDLSLEKICSELGVSESYFSSIFKKETGEAFVGFLTSYRMQVAARMLMETDAKNYEIAARTGYADANYFSYVFKKQYGMSPSKYRQEHGN